MKIEAAALLQSLLAIFVCKCLFFFCNMVIVGLIHRQAATHKLRRELKGD